MSREPDAHDALLDNLESREENRARAAKEGGGRVAKSGNLVFVDISEKGPARNPRDVWVSEKNAAEGTQGVLGPREPSTRERRKAVLRVDAPKLMPRIRRNW